jgi:hypothetical protein
LHLELTPLGPDLANPAADHRQLGRISNALDELATVEPRLAQIVDLKFLLRRLVRGDRRHASGLGKNSATGLGEGAVVSAPGALRR